MPAADPPAGGPMSAHTTDQRLAEVSKALRMPTIRSSYGQLAEWARGEQLSYEAYLLELLGAEAEVRRQNRVRRLLRESRLPAEKTLDRFDRRRLPPHVNGQLSVLIEGDFLKRSENILAFGNPGSGKTHLLCAIAHELIHRGYRILFSPCSMLVQQLLAAKSQLTLPRLLKRLLR